LHSYAIAWPWDDEKSQCAAMLFGEPCCARNVQVFRQTPHSVQCTPISRCKEAKIELSETTYFDSVPKFSSKGPFIHTIFQLRSPFKNVDGRSLIPLKPYCCSLCLHSTEKQVKPIASTGYINQIGSSDQKESMERKMIFLSET
jgi:hypothetical protein